MISSLERRKKIARRLREWFPGATYHLMERGVRRQEIFQDEFDYQVFTELLKTAAEDNGCMIHAYCFMTNHFHLLVETGDMEIGKFMKQIACKYAMYYNHRYGYKGHVFEGRYKSCLVQTDEYFLQTSRYIHLNPVKAGMVFRPEAYRWSSYRGMVNMQDDGITFHAKTLAYFKNGGIYGYRISGILENGHSLIRSRPFRAPHHDASLNALIGGGVNVMPGEVSLAHNGVLFLDELAEFSRRTAERAPPKATEWAKKAPGRPGKNCFFFWAFPENGCRRKHTRRKAVRPRPG